MRTKQMRELRILSLTRRRRQRGQMAIFVVLIFQVLFVFFAMALNVALVVHDKINLQNSVDLAALYGAQKQAEVLNVLAHINFQMRQNFKLLAWRYRILGSITYIGDKGNDPLTVSAQPPIPGDHWCPYAITDGGIQDGSYDSCKPQNSPYPAYPSPSSGPDPCNRPPATHIYPGNYCDANYFVCISASVWLRGTSIDTNTNHCGHLETDLQAVVPFVNLPGPLEGLTGALLDRHMALGSALARKCEEEGFYNWLITHMFLGHFRLDQKDRKVMIREIYNRTLQLGLDLDGNSIKEGVRRTFQKNLTYTNRTNLEPSANPIFQVFHSPQAKDIKDFFTPIHIFPVLEYLDFPNATTTTTIDSNSCSDAKRALHYQLPAKWTTPSPSSSSDLNSFVNAWKWLFAVSTKGGTLITPGPSTPSPPIFFPPDQDGLLYPLTLGYERTDKIFYYGVSAKVNYKSAFPLFFPGLKSGDLQLTASAVAKPFGGRMGPKKAELDERIEPILIETGNTRLTSGNPYLLKPNYSRYPGDVWGLIHRSAHEEYYLEKPHGLGSLGSPNPAPYDIMHFGHLYGGDPLAFNSGEPHFLFVRMMELMAVAPDLYDMTYYSPLNHYMTAYFPRICHLFTGSDCEDGKRAIEIGDVNGDAGPVKAFLRGDFGFPYTTVYSNLNKNRLGVFSPLSTFYFNLGTTGFSIPHLSGNEGKYMYKTTAPWLVKDPAHFLTAWAPIPTMERYRDYDFPTDLFGKCRAVAEEEKPVPSGCVSGGRAGYSVKLISCEMATTLSPSIPEYICSD